MADYFSLIAGDFAMWIGAGMVFRVILRGVAEVYFSFWILARSMFGGS